MEVQTVDSLLHKAMASKDLEYKVQSVWTTVMIPFSIASSHHMLICMKMDIVNIFQNISFWVPQKKKCHTGLEQEAVSEMSSYFVGT